MLKKIRDAFKIKELRSRIGFTFLMLIVIRIGSLLPVPGVDSDVFSQLFGSSDSALNFFDSITGGSFSEMSIFALSITPYITASIIIQLLTIAIPALEDMHKDGEDGRKKLTQITRYTTIGLALIEAVPMAIGFGRGGYLDSYNFLSVFSVVATLVGGSAVLMWIGELITKHGIGNGISIVLVLNIISRFPSDIATLYKQFMEGKTVAKATLSGIVIALIIIAIVVLVDVFSAAERKLPVQNAQKMAGRRQTAASQSNIPMKVLTANVIPVIFAQSIMQTPVIIAQLAKARSTGFWGAVLTGLSQSNWFKPGNMLPSIGCIVYIALILFFAYFYTSITFNPLEIAEQLKSRGASIPGIRSGKPTAEYIEFVLNKIIFIGAVALAVIAIIPLILNGIFSANVSFLGTSLIIVIGVIVETMKQIESLMTVRSYKGFLND